MTFKKDDAEKPLMGCLPPNALLATARVLTFGAKKYGRDNWHQVDGWSRYYDAPQRHLFAWWSGENLDKDTGESHLAHAACCLLFLAELEALGKSQDDRPSVDRRPLATTRALFPLHRMAPGSDRLTLCGSTEGTLARDEVSFFREAVNTADPQFICAFCYNAERTTR